MTLMPSEIRATVKLYFDGKIRQWYSRGDGRGVIFLVDAKTVDEARAMMDTLPLAKEQLMDHEYIPVGPLMPLRALIGGGPARNNDELEESYSEVSAAERIDHAISSFVRNQCGVRPGRLGQQWRGIIFGPR